MKGAQRSHVSGFENASKTSGRMLGRFVQEKVVNAI
jgi:hypothetical protein